MAKKRAMETGNARYLTAALGLALALVGALTLTSYVMVGQQAGSGLNPVAPPTSARVIASRPDISEPLVLPPIAEQQPPAPKPEPQPDGAAPVMEAGAPDENAPAPETARGSIVAQVVPDLAEKISGHVGSVLRAGTIPPPIEEESRNSLLFEPVAKDAASDETATGQSDGTGDPSANDSEEEEPQGKPDDDDDGWGDDADDDPNDGWDDDDSSDQSNDDWDDDAGDDSTDDDSTDDDWDDDSDDDSNDNDWDGDSGN